VELANTDDVVHVPIEQRLHHHRAQPRLHARTHPGTDNRKAVIVAVPDAPDILPLPGVTAETMTLRQFLRTSWS
jgi:hypothetical protein